MSPHIRIQWKDTLAVFVVVGFVFEEKSVCSHRLGSHLEAVWHSRDTAVDQNNCC